MSKTSTFFFNNKKILGFVLLLFAVIALITHEVKHRLNTHTFIAGNLTEFEGMYFEQPFPMLVFDDFYIPKGAVKNALIVGPGKTGAQSIFQELEKKHGALNGKSIRLSGTIYTTDERSLIELSEGADALLAIERSYTYPIQRTNKKALTIVGEIVNAKCWLSAKQNSAGYFHQRCSKSCIEKGIPPLLKVKSESGNAFYLLSATTAKGKTAILDHVAKEVEISGAVNFQNGWSVLSIDENSIRSID